MSHDADVSKSHLNTDGTGVDGSGAIAIKMIQTDTKMTIFLDVIRLIFSICLLIFSTASVVYAIATKITTVPDNIPPVVEYIGLVASLFILGTLEGLQIGVVELAHKDPNNYRRLYPRAAKLLAFENKGRNVECFLMGRQVLVVFTVFVAARITTFEGFWHWMNGLSYSGFLGVILVVVVAQLTPQVLAAAYPVQFLNLPGMKIAFWACLIVEATGLVHAVWFLCVIVKKLLYKCVCARADFARLLDESPGDSTTDVTNRAGMEIDITNDMLKAAENAESKINEEVELAKKDKEERSKWKTEYASKNDDMDDQMNNLITEVGNNRNLFYIHGDEKYMSAAQCYDKFKEAGLTPPQFLLPPEDQNHIPPHIIAMTLLKMYTAPSQEKVDDLDKKDL